MLEIIKTRDGSCTLANAELNETYHSINGAMTESMHVFIKNGLLKYIDEKETIHILEIGLGTCLNALLTLENIPNGKTVFYTSIEPFPITIEILETYYETFEKKPIFLNRLIEMITCDEGHFNSITPQFNFSQVNKKYQFFTLQDSIELYAKFGQNFIGYDIIYFDAFAPQKQPDMWDLENLKNIVEQMSKNALLTSYCAQGQFKRNLKNLLLKVEALEGPPGKREMTIAYK